MSPVFDRFGFPQKSPIIRDHLFNSTAERSLSIHILKRAISSTGLNSRQRALQSGTSRSVSRLSVLSSFIVSQKRPIFVAQRNKSSMFEKSPLLAERALCMRKEPCVGGKSPVYAQRALYISKEPSKVLVSSDIGLSYLCASYVDIPYVCVCTLYVCVCMLYVCVCILYVCVCILYVCVYIHTSIFKSFTFASASRYPPH